MPRLFTALSIPEEISQQLSLLRGGLPGARWIEPEDYHITLSFAGEVSADVARDIDDELSRIEIDPLTIHIGELGSFGGDHPRLVVVKVEASQALLELQAKGDQAIRRAAGPTDRRKYAPHITIARLKKTAARDVADYISRCGLRRTLEFSAQEITLYSARPSTGGGPYIVEAVYPLTGGPPALRPAASQ